MSNVEAAIERIANGGMVIVIDDADREAEGDLVMAGSHCTPEAMAFIIRHSCGIVCAPLSAAEARRLQLAPMVAQNDAPLATAFTVSVDITHGLTTGISAEQRSNTIRGLANPNMGSADFVRPGHVFPLIARDGGVLMRSGHTEAAVDLCRLAKQPPVGVICELANDDGTVMKGRQIYKFAELHEIPVISVEEMICWRREREVLITRSEAFQCETVVGPMTGYAFSTPFDSIRHFAFVLGDIKGDKPVPVRIHRSSVVTDVIVSDSIVHRSLQKMAAEGCGVLIYLREGSCGVPLASLDSDMPKSEEQRQSQWLEVGLGAQILNSLKVCRIKLITERQVNYVGLGGFGLKIEAVERAD
ncbi:MULTISPECIES: 3,4-dihydroxy-2-butanone-4-phosphate synthase [Roseovarius]|jgi:3,4-dihydroxy 2-butanone 4-phosphate synthase/GTP cyclohydrolase II|uniref:3,4-dihydroxy-2-butanone-4-phosphate synthase n=1 Tax=Roseovarius TaxID=74030 RepID=UPI000CDD1922|nr:MULTISPECIES: 3,4-dihydroxy-2-butanone-4-phosphate synthase [Roseovarius]